MIIRYIGELLDHSGYGIAARINVALLTKMGHQVQCLPTGAKSSTDPDWKIQTVISNMVSENSPKPDVVIAHIYPPHALKNYKIPGVPLISYIAWEVDLLSSIWVYQLNKHADIVVTTCTEMRDVFVDSGVEKPVFVVGPTVFPEDINKLNEEISPEAKQRLSDVDKDGKFRFYSIFQWIERKDPKKLISAFIQEFDNNEDVSLILKTYRLGYSEAEFNAIVNEIRVIAKEIGVIYPPEIRIVPHMLTEMEMRYLHKLCDCYVSPHRGEGTGLGIMDAILHKNPVITTMYGGPNDFARSEGVYPLPYKMIPVMNPVHLKNYFNAYMNWADVDITELKKAMRWTYENRDRKMYNTKHSYDVLTDLYSVGENTRLMNRVLDEAQGFVRSHNTIGELSK